ncbi:hypothetical protein [uncultured Microbacterium sp.]|uniref:hypothetical protein n=1 Tax=uncultured Microbacterium sp. TaxID=191216 RepID=UPI0025F5B614|nr:hypothetical protein [uncultured Microbacterium sp.]
MSMPEGSDEYPDMDGVFPPLTKREDSLEAVEEIINNVITAGIEYVDLDMSSQAVGIIVNEHAPADPAERDAYLVEVAQRLANLVAWWCTNSVLIQRDGGPE